MPNDELEDLKKAVSSDDESDEGSDDTDPASEETEGEKSESEEETVEVLKARLAKAESDRDNYKQGLLSRKSKERSLDIQKEADVSPEAPDISEEKVLSVLYKQNEKATMKAVINPTSPLYLPELVDDKQFQTIVSEYLPRNIDKSSPEGIHKALRIAVAAWKVDNSIEIKPDTKSARAKLQEKATGTQEGGSVETKKAIKKLNIPQQVSPRDWYKK